MDRPLAVGDGQGADMDSDFIYRDARAEDRSEVLAFTTHTWDFGDYIGEVYDDWLNDPAGRFIVAYESGTGRIAAIDKLSFFGAGQAWFEGLRVNPEFRGRGLATRTQRYMIAEAKRLGVRTIRFLTLVTNQPLHVMAYRDGFHMRFVVRDWRGATDSSAGAHDGLDTTALREATQVEAPALFAWWQRAAFYATCGLVHHNWQYGESSLEEWQHAAGEGYLLVSAGYEEGATTPPPIVLVRPNKYSEASTSWTVGAIAAPFGGTSALICGLKQKAVERDVSEIGGLFADTFELYNGLKAALMNPDPDEERLCLFELTLR